MSRAKQLIGALLESPAFAGQEVSKAEARNALLDTAIGVMGPGAKKAGAFSINSASGRQIRFTKNFIEIKPIQAFFGGDYATALARAIIFDRHADEAKELAETFRRKGLANLTRVD
mgnify:CR=1 FL=1